MEHVASPAKKVELEKRESNFGSATGRVRSYQEEAAVDPALRSKLESIGMRTRFNVGRGYGSPPPSQSLDQFTTIDGGAFMSNNQILQSVRNTTKSWNRTKSAPLYNNELVPFCGLRADITLQDENDDPTSAAISTQEQGEDDGAGVDEIGMGDLKRSRDDVFGDWANDEDEQSMEMDAATTDKPIAALPRRSSPRQGSLGLNRASAHTLPVSSSLSYYVASAQDIDFSTYTNDSDF
ncbi:hypothetical protein CBS101457_004794 [Exobasidium rhododendri]|nr:hypothetical protein CBS101457_004794 [Exobasidium rhododendri]